MKTLTWAQLSAVERDKALKRPQLSNNQEMLTQVLRIINQVKADGDNTLKALTRRFDHVACAELRVSSDELAGTAQQVSDSVLKAIDDACDRIKRFHQACMPQAIQMETAQGVVCERVSRPLKTVGLYVPAGSAPLPSAAMMLGIPAMLAGCDRIVLCSPPNAEGQVDASVCAVAQRLGIKIVCRIGGAQAIAAMAYGTESVPKCDKIFGPGNRWVTMAKQQVAMDPFGAAIDMPAGPSEVMVLADQQADAEFVAADLLSQAEHGPDSQALLVTDSVELGQRVALQVETQVSQLPREDIARQALQFSKILLTEDLQQSIEIANSYAAEHLIINTLEPRAVLQKIRAAGSVFLGAWSPEAVGDYCSGTNHVLPTYGYARSYSGLSVDSFMTFMTVQELSQQGIIGIGPTAQILAKAEGLDAHERAVAVRLARIESFL